MNLFFSLVVIAVLIALPWVLVAAAGLEPRCRDIVAVCLSSAVAEALVALPFAETRIAEIPEQTALVALLTRTT